MKAKGAMTAIGAVILIVLVYRVAWYQGRAACDSLSERETSPSNWRNMHRMEGSPSNEQPTHVFSRVSPALSLSERETSPSESETEFAYLDRVREDCGELCDTTRSGKPGLFFDEVSAKVDCQKIIANPHWDKGHPPGPPPKTIPPHLLYDFTTSGKVPVKQWYIEGGGNGKMYLGGEAAENIWTKEMVDEQIAQAKAGTLKGTYSVQDTNQLLAGMRKARSIVGGRVMVIGSERPWVEACALAAGAASVVTLEYGTIRSEHPQITTLIPPQFREKFLDKTLGTFDVIVTYSSVEHAGLGRYGDALNPWADIITMAQAWCVTKPEGQLVLGVMSYSTPQNYATDQLMFNAHRVYGAVRFPYLTTNWRNTHRMEGSPSNEQPTHVFSRVSPALRSGS